MDFDWLTAQGFDRLTDFLTALAIGLLIGLERERAVTAKAGLRTCAIVSMTGGAATLIAETLMAPAVIAVGLGTIGIAMVAVYYRDPTTGEGDPGTTTIAAVLACYLLGCMAVAGSASLAVMLAIATTVLLYFKAELGGFARNLERHELISTFQFAVVAFIILPLLPDVDTGPYGTLNPKNVWGMVVLISGVSLAGYVALKSVGPRRAILLGLLGGMVSSTATTLAYARMAAEERRFEAFAARAILAAGFMVPVRLAVLTAAVAPSLLGPLGRVLAPALAAGVVVFAFQLRRRPELPDAHAPEVKNPAQLRAAISFAVLYGAVLVLSAWLTDLFGSPGVYATAALSGAADVDAIALSTMRLAGQELVTPAQATVAITIAVATNAAFKLGIAGFAGGRQLMRLCAPGIAAMIAGLAAGAFFLPGSISR